MAVGAVRDAEPRRRGRARGRVRHHPLRGGVLSDVARLHAAVADADRPDAAPLAERRRGRALVALSGGAVRRHLQRAGAPARPASTSSAPCCTASTPTASRFARQPDDYLLFLGRFTEGKGVLQAIEIAKRVGMRLILAAAEDDVLSRARRAARRRPPHRLLRRGRLRGQGEAVRRRARAALPDSGARAVRPGARRGDGVRHAGRRARSRRRPRGRRRRRDRHGLRRSRADDRTTCRASSLSIAAASTSRRSRGSASTRMVDEYIAVYRRLVEAHRGPTLSAALALAGRTVLARLRPSRRRVAGLRRHAGAARRRRRPRRRACARRAASADRSAIPSLVPDGDLGRVRDARAARRRRGPRRRRGHHARSPGRRPALGRRAGAARRDRRGRSERYRPDAVITFAEDGLYWHLDHIGVHERTYTAVQSLGAAAPPLYYVTMPHGVMREVVDAAHAKGGAPPDSSFWGIAPDAFGDGAKPPTLRRSTCATGCRASWPRCAATGRRWAPNNPIAWIDDEEARRWLGVEHFRRVAARRGRRSDPRASRRNRNMRIETLDLLRCPYCGGRLDARRLAVPPPQRRRDSGRHPRLPLLHLPGRRRHPGPAPAAGGDQPRAIRSRPAARSGAPHDVRPRRRGAGRARSTPSPSSDIADLSRHRRGARAELRGRLFSLSLLRSRPTSSRRRWRARSARHGARRGAARDRHLRRLRPPDAVAARSLVARRRCSPICTSRRSGWRAASPRPAASRSAATATRRCRSRAARSASRCAPTRSCTSGRSGSSSARWSGSSTATRRAGRGADRPHAQRADLEPVARPAAVAGGLRDSVRDASSRASSARPACSTDVVNGGPLDLSRRDDAGDARPRSGADHHRQPQPAASSRRIRSPQPRAGSRRAPHQPAVRRRSPMATGSACGSVPVRGLRAGVRRLPASTCRRK